MAEGDKVVPSGGNPQLDPTANGALNSTLGRTSGALNSTLGTTQGSMTNDKTRSGSLTGNRWIRNQSGLLIRNDEIEVERDVYRNRSANRKGPSSSVDEVMRRGQEDFKKSMQGYSKDLRLSKNAEKSGSPDGESKATETPTASDFQRNQSAGKQPIPRNRVDVFAGMFGQLAFGNPVLRQAATMALGSFPLQTLVPRCVGPFISRPTNHDGGVPQSNANESATKGQNVNNAETETAPDGNG